MRISNFLPVCLATLLLPGLSRAEVKLPAIFGDHMVLQRDIDVPVWGTAAPGETVTVTAGDDKGSATADKDGKWMVRLAKLTATGKPITVTVAGKNTITFQDVLVGDVWLCSGQSNMQLGTMATNAKTIAANEPDIRIFSVPKWVTPFPAADIGAKLPEGPMQGSWVVCSPETLAKDGDWVGFPAVAYVFGKNIHDYTHLPVGLIGSTWGGTPAQPWVSLETLQVVPQLQGSAKSVLSYRANYEKLKQDYQTQLAQWKDAMAKWTVDNKDAIDAYNAKMDEWRKAVRAAVAEHKPGPSKPAGAPVAPRPPRDYANNNQTSSGIFNGMIAPLIPYAIKGAIWYQGESNGTQPGLYHAVLPALIKDWRMHWGEGDFPFLVVQLPNYMTRLPQPAESDWAGIREAQSQITKLPNTGYAVTIDLGEAGNIHPVDKVDVGNRLALVAEHVAYGDSNVTYSGPTYKDMKIEGNTIRIEFDNVDGGLVIGRAPDLYYTTERLPIPTAPDTTLQGFAIAGADQKYVWADAKIDGNAVVLSAPSVPNPVSVRYAWANNPACNLYNKAGLPAAPFRTDNIAIPR